MREIVLRNDTEDKYSKKMCYSQTYIIGSNTNFFDTLNFRNYPIRWMDSNVY